MLGQFAPSVKYEKFFQYFFLTSRIIIQSKNDHLYALKSASLQSAKFNNFNEVCSLWFERKFRIILLGKLIFKLFVINFTKKLRNWLISCLSKHLKELLFILLTIFFASVKRIEHWTTESSSRVDKGTPTLHVPATTTRLGETKFLNFVRRVFCILITSL